MKKRQGFTLIELIIVIAVISILLGIALPRLRGMIEEGNTARAAAECRALQAAVESYYIHHSKVYPATGTTWQSALTGASPKLIGVALTDPFSSSSAQYQFAKSANGFYYLIWSVGPDNTAGITGVDNTGAVTGTAGDDIYVSNGTSGTG